MKNGWIKMYRTLLDSAVFADAELLRVCMYCVLQASYRAMTIPVGRQVITLQPGQLLYGRKAVSNRLGIGEGKLRGLMNQLEQMGIIAVESCNRYSIVTIREWNAYQTEQGKNVFPFDCDFLDEDEPLEIVNDSQQKSALLTALEADFDESITSTEPAENHKQEENNNNKNNNKIKKESEKKKINSGAALRAVRRYRRADGELFTKGNDGDCAVSDEGHSVPGGAAAVPCGNGAEAQPEEYDAIHHDNMIEMQYDIPDESQLTQMEQDYWQQNCVEISDLTWDIDDDMNWGIDPDVYAELAEATADDADEIDETDPYEQQWVEAHQLFNQLWNKYPVKVGKQKVSDIQIMELYEVGRDAMIQAINTCKEKKRRVPKKYWMNGSTFFNGGYRGYL